MIQQLLLQVAWRGATAIVYDPESEYVTQFHKPERGDVVLNPLGIRMPYWSPGDHAGYVAVPGPLQRKPLLC